MQQVSELKQKVELRLGKLGPLRFISHHDMLRLLERSARRAGLPLRYTGGYNHRPRIVLPVPLEVGVESTDEPVEMELSQWLAVPEIRARLAKALPAEMPLYSARLLPPRRQSQQPVEVSYEARCAEISEQQVAKLLQSESIPWQRKRPNEVVKLDLRKSILGLELDGDILRMRLKPGKGTVRPYEVLEYLLGSREKALLVPVKRTRTVLAPVEVAGRSTRRRKR